MEIQATAIPILVGRDFKPTINLVNENGEPWVLTGVTELRFFDSESTVARFVATLANGRISSIVGGTLVLNILAAQTSLLVENFGTMEILRTTGQLIAVARPTTRMIAENEPLAGGIATTMEITVNTGAVKITSSFVGGFDLAIGTVQMGDTPVASISGTLGNQLLNLTLPRGLPGSNGILSPAEILKGIAALDAIPDSLLRPKMASVDFIGGGFANLDESSGQLLCAFENVPSLTFTNVSGGKYISRKRILEEAAAATVRKMHSLDGRAMGGLFEGAFSYLNGRTQPTVAQLVSGLNVTDAVTPPGEAGAWIQFAPNPPSTVNSYVANISWVAGTRYHIQAEIIMDDGSAPNLQAGTGGDGAFRLAGEFVLQNPDTEADGLKVIGPLANNKYIVQGYILAPTTVTSSYGIRRTVTQGSKGMRVGRINVGVGKVPPSLFDNATATPNARAAETLRIPISGYSFNGGLSLLARFTPQNRATAGYLVEAQQNSSNRAYLYVTATNQVSMNYVLAGTNHTCQLDTSLTIGQEYTVVGSIDNITGRIRLKASGIAAPAEFTTLPSVLSANPVFLHPGTTNSSAGHLAAPLAVAAVFDNAFTASELQQALG